MHPFYTIQVNYNTKMVKKVGTGGGFSQSTHHTCTDQLSGGRTYIFSLQALCTICSSAHMYCSFLTKIIAINDNK